MHLLIFLLLSTIQSCFRSRPVRTFSFFLRCVASAPALVRSCSLSCSIFKGFTFCHFRTPTLRILVHNRYISVFAVKPGHYNNWFHRICCISIDYTFSITRFFFCSVMLLLCIGNSNQPIQEQQILLL